MAAYQLTGKARSKFGSQLCILVSYTNRVLHGLRSNVAGIRSVHDEVTTSYPGSQRSPQSTCEKCSCRSFNLVVTL